MPTTAPGEKAKYRPEQSIRQIPIKLPDYNNKSEINLDKDGLKHLKSWI